MRSVVLNAVGGFALLSSQGCTNLNASGNPNEDFRQPARCWDLQAVGLERGYCVADARYLCGSEGASLLKKKFYAVPRLGESCSTLRMEQDFFSADLFQGDEDFLRVVANASLIVRDTRLAEAGLKEAGFSKSVIDELLAHRMACAILLKFNLSAEGDQDRFDLVFRLPESEQTVVLSLNQDGSDPEWALLLHEGPRD
jgi:hypothetical protein